MEGFADIEGPLPIGMWPLILMIAAAVLLVLLTAFLLHRFIKRPRRAPLPDTEQKRSALEIALERLRRLGSGDARIEPEPFTVEVSDIVRDYLEEALSIPAREQTSEEFLGTLSSRENLPAVLHAHMPAFLESCDMVKFARQRLDSAQQENLLATAREVVESTDAELAASLNEPDNTARAV